MELNPIPLKTTFNVRAVENISYYRCPQNYVFAGETHNCWEFLYVDRGSVVVTAGDTVYFMKSGELAFHRPGEFHSFHTVGEADIIVVSFYCSSPAMHRLEQKVLLLHSREKDQLKRLVDEAQQVYMHFENDPPYIRMVKLDSAPWACDQMIKNYLEQLLIMICRRDDNIGFSQRAIAGDHLNQGPVLAQRAKDYLNEHYSEQISLDSLATALGVSVSQIKRVFREQIGQSMVNYLASLRIGQAKRLIREGNLNFTQVAEQVGYETIYYFSSLFKKRTGMTLTEYAKSLKD
ncbi:MAG: helix-turn-helix domain-containing protein [Ruminococcaceae bacterium]|nr:helix-turn-helix domain-containing protein [Oscillospiraceae bacterium]